MADIRSNIASIGSQAALSAESCVSFSRKEAEYAKWRETHQENGFVLDRDTATSKAARLHRVTCPEVSEVEEGGRLTGSPKIGCPTKQAAVSFAQTKKWRLVTTCEQCLDQVAT